MDKEFQFTDQIRAEDKYFDVSLSEVEHTLRQEGKYEWFCDHYVNGSDPLVLRLNMNTGSAYPTSWTAALKLKKTRIDGIDYEPIFKTADGRKGRRERGWHRHQWDTANNSAERCKHPLPRFGDGRLEITDFVIRVAAELRITFSGR